MYMLIAQAANEAAAAGFQGIPGAPNWLNSILILAVPVIGFFVTQYINARKAETLARLQNENLSKKERLELRLKTFALMQAEAFVQKDMFQIASDVMKNKETGAKSPAAIASSARDALKTAGERVMNDAIEYFNEDDIDIVSELGETNIKQAIRWAADAASPFPGKPTVEVLVNGGAEALVSMGSVRLKKLVEETGDIKV
jgi:hypothetical protein